MKMTARRGGHFFSAFCTGRPGQLGTPEGQASCPAADRAVRPKMGKFQYRDALWRKIIVQETSIILKFDKI